MSDGNPGPLVLQPQERERWHEMLKISHLVVILFYMRTMHPRPVTQLELKESFNIDRKTAAKYLRQLSQRNYITHISNRAGYALADGAHSFFEMWGKNGHMTLKESFNQDLKIKDKNERKKEVGSFWTLAKKLDAETILSETHLLFDGKTVTSFAIEQSDPLTVLMVLAHAYDQRDRLKSPAGFAYRRLQRQQAPDKKYQHDPEQYLPNDFLHALGLQELKVLDVEPEQDETEAWSLDEEPEPSPECKWWESVKGQLQMEMPRSLFDTWVRDTKAVRFENETMCVSVRNAYARDWLDNRIASTAQRLLVGIMNQSVSVEFVVAAETEMV